MTGNRGWFIVFEGGDAAGKSTQARLLAERLGARLTREPGGTPLGERIRDLVLDPAIAVDPKAEALLMAAARAEHVSDVIAPALARGETVVTDRFVASSIAYQGHGRGLSADEIDRLNRWATGGLVPDLIVFLDVSDPVASTRLGERRDRLEAAGGDFHQRVAESYRAQASADPDRWLLVDGDGTVEEVADRVRAALEARGLFQTPKYR